MSTKPMSDRRLTLDVTRRRLLALVALTTAALILACAAVADVSSPRPVAQLGHA
jgi:hypothetical protein